MINDTYNCAYLHVPKTGGTSILNSFGIDWNDENTLYFLSYNAYYWKKNLRFTTSISDLPKKYFIFTVVRNPWERFISGWKYCAPNITIEHLLNNLPTEGHDYDHITKTQYEMITKNGELIPNYLIRFEDFQLGFDNVCDIIKKPRVILKKLNYTIHEPYQEYFNERTLKLFNEKFHKDIELLNYKFDN